MQHMDKDMERLSGRDIVCFANDWDGDPLSKKHVMRRLAERNRVLWVDSLGNRAPRVDVHDARRVVKKLQKFARGVVEVERNLWVLSPIAVPAYKSQIAKAVNARLVAAEVRLAMKWLGFTRPLLYTFVPASAWVLGRLGEAQVVYHCVDEYASFAGAGPEIAALEEELIRKSDLVITCSEPLRVRKSVLNPKTVLVRHGVDYDHFAKALDPKTVVPPELAALPKPVIGFHGLVAEWIDLALIRRVADANPEASVVIVGEVRADTSALDGAKNVHFFGRKPYAELPGWCKGFDVALLPFTIDDLTVHANPLKLREYVAAGLPVVSTAIPEARALGKMVTVAETADDFVAAVKAALLDVRGPTPARSHAVAEETWDHQVRAIERHVLALDEARTPVSAEASEPVEAHA